MKSYSKFIIEKKKGTVSASPAPGDPLDPKGRKKIDKKFSDPANPPKVANPEAPKPNPAPKPTAVNQADVSKQAAKYRRAERVKGATGGKTTGSLSKGTLSFPGDRSGATARVKADIEARKGFSGSKSGGLKSDETSRFVDRSVRQQRAIKQGVPDPFTSKTPAPARPFKGISKKTKTGSPSIPDPFKSATTDPKKVTPKPKAPSGPGPATSQAIKDIRSSMSRRGVQTTETDVVQRYMRKAQDAGRRIDPDLVGAQGVKASGAKPEMVGKRAPSGSGARFRAQADAARDISKRRTVDLDKALRNLTKTGDVRGTGGTPLKPSITRKTGTPSTFKDFSQKAKQFEPPKPPKLPKPPKSPSYKLPDTRTNVGTTRVKDTQPRTVNPSTNKPIYQNATRSGYKPEFKPQSGSEMVKGGKSKPKVTVNKTGTKPTLTPRPTTPLSDTEKKVADALRKAALSGKDADGNILSTAERKARFQQSRNPRMAVPTSPSGTSGTGGTGGGSMKPFKPSSGSGGGALATYKPKPQKPPKPTPAQVQRTPRLAAAAKNAPVTQASLNKTLRGIGGRALGLAGAGYDAVSSYQEYRKRGDSQKRAGVKSAFRTGLGYAGGALGGLAGLIGGGGIGSAALGTAGAIGGYSAGTWLADKVLGATRYERKKRAREKAAAANQK